MQRILLVEPEYQNKYPPIGLMKLATYHKDKNDYVEFYKGKAPYHKIIKFDRIYITSLFTFHYRITIETVKHYMNYTSSDNIYVGGIAVSIIADKFKKDLKNIKIITGQLFSSNVLGYGDNINIDSLPLDYDILDDVEYEYPAGDNFFIYTTRGCPRSCAFCAVKKLEPDFMTTNHICSQIDRIREKYGDKRNVLIMDNNILFSKDLTSIVDDLIKVGFKKNSPTYEHPNKFLVIYAKINRRKQSGNSYEKLLDELIDYVINFSKTPMSKQHELAYSRILSQIIRSNNKFRVIKKLSKDIIPIIDKYRFKKKLQRYVDFNQGVDARLLTEDKMRVLSALAIKPLRLAYDNYSLRKIYNNAFLLACKYGIKYYSNYMLYNYNDKPEDLWNRLRDANLLFNNNRVLHGFSFPMKYAPIFETDRDYIGKYWNKKYLSALNVILNVTKGAVAKELDFFYEAFGKNTKEFIRVLTMPSKFIRQRSYFKSNGLMNIWLDLYKSLSKKNKTILLRVLTGVEDISNVKCEKLIRLIKMY